MLILILTLLLLLLPRTIIIEIITIIIILIEKNRLIRQLVIRSFGPVTAVKSHIFQVVYVSVKAVVILFQVDIRLKK